MKTLAKIIVVLLILILGVCVAAYMFINLKGKDLIVAQLDNALRPQVEMESLKLIFPATIQIKNLDIENFLTADELLIQPSFLTLLSGNIGFSKIVLTRPEITILKNADGSLNVASLLKPTTGESKPVIIGELIIEDGKVDFIDRKVDSKGFHSKIVNLNMKVSNPISPRFKISAEIQGKESSGSLRASGWANLLRKDMDADFEISNVDAAYFSPYFKNFSSDRKLKSAILNSRVTLSAENNQVDGKCHLEVNNIVYEEPPEEQAQEEKRTASPLALIFGEEGNSPQQISLDLPIKGTLIPFKMNFVKITGSVFSEMLKNTISGDPEEISEKVEDIGERFKAFGKELEKAFKKETETQE